MKTPENSPRLFRLARTFKLDADVDRELRRTCEDRKLHLSDYVNNALRATLGITGEPPVPLRPKGKSHEPTVGWLQLEPSYKEMLRWWPQVGKYYKLDELIRLATPVVDREGVPDRPWNLRDALRGLCRCGARLDGVTPGKLGAVLRYWRGHWRDGRAVQRGEGGWGVVARETW